MTENQKQSTKKWIEFSENSDEDSSHGDNDSAEGKKELTPLEKAQSQKELPEQQKQLNLLENCRNMVWLYVRHTENDALVEVLEKFVQQNEQFKLYPSKDNVKKGWDLKVNKQTAKDILINGIQTTKRLSFEVSERNFKSMNEGRGGDRRGRGRGDRRGGHRDYRRGDNADENGKRQYRNDRGDRRERPDREYRNDRGDRGDRGGRGDRGDRDERRTRGGDREPGRKKTYINKQTGQKPDNKKNYELKAFEEKQRKYTREEAEKNGSELGAFRNVPLEKRTFSQTEQPQKTVENKKEKVVLEREREQTKKEQTWARKGSKAEEEEEESKKQQPNVRKQQPNTKPEERQDFGKKKTYKAKYVEQEEREPMKKRYTDSEGREPIKKKYSEKVQDGNKQTKKTKNNGTKNGYFQDFLEEDSN